MRSFLRLLNGQPAKRTAGWPFYVFVLLFLFKLFSRISSFELSKFFRPARRRDEVFTRFFYKKIAGAGQSPAAARVGPGAGPGAGLCPAAARVGPGAGQSPAAARVEPRRRSVPWGERGIILLRMGLDCGTIEKMTASRWMIWRKLQGKPTLKLT